MSSFRWGMVACSTLTYGQMAYRKVQATYVFSSLQYCCFPSCFSLISLGSAAIPLHFRLSFCNPLVQIRSPYLIWKRTFRAICWYKNLDYGPSDRHFMTKFLKEMGQASYVRSLYFRCYLSQWPSVITSPPPPIYFGRFCSSFQLLLLLLLHLSICFASSDMPQIAILLSRVFHLSWD